MVSTFQQDGKEYLQVDNSAMTYMLVNTIKELNQKIENLESEKYQLKKDINLLREEMVSIQKNLDVISSLLTSGKNNNKTLTKN